MEKNTQLPRVLGPWMAVALVIGTVIGAGVFKKPATIAGDISSVGLILAAWVLVGVFTLMGALSLAEVAILFPRAGGNYVYLNQALGNWAGFLYGWVEFWIIRSASIAALASVFTDSLQEILMQWQQRPPSQPIFSIWQHQGIAMTVIVILTALNARGVRLGGSFQLLISTVKVCTLLAIALMPLLLWVMIPRLADLVATDNLQPIWPSDWSDVNWSKFGKAIIGVLWAYHGWMNLAPVGEEIENPGRNLPLAFIVGTLAVMVLYVSANVSYHLVIPHQEMASYKAGTVVGLFCLKLFGSIGGIFASTAVMISVFGALNGNLLVGPRLVFAMGRDGVAPRALAELHPRYQTPFVAHWVLTGWALLMMVGVAALKQAGYSQNKSAFDTMTDYAMFGAVAFETLAVASLFVLRHRFPPSTTPLPYRTPLYPFLTIIYVAGLFVLWVNMFFDTGGPEEGSEHWHGPAIGLGFVLLGAVVYFGRLAIQYFFMDKKDS